MRKIEIIIIIATLIVLAIFFGLPSMQHFDTENHYIDYDGTWVNGNIPMSYGDPMQLPMLIGDGYNEELIADWEFTMTIESPSGITYDGIYHCEQSAAEYYLQLDPYHIIVPFDGDAFDELGLWTITSGELTGINNDMNRVVVDSLTTVGHIEVTELNPIEDNDNDGISNSEDNCPDTYNPSQEDSNNDGIGDACETPSPYDPPDNDEDFLSIPGFTFLFVLTSLFIAVIARKRFNS